MKVEVAVLGSPSLISLMVFVDVKQHFNGLYRETVLVTEAGDTKEAANIETSVLSLHKTKGNAMIVWN